MASSGDKVVFFLMGGFIGASIALLFAPKAGDDTREFLGQKYREGTEGLTQKAEAGKQLITEKSRETAEKMAETIDRGKESLLRQKDQLTAAIDAGREAYEGEKKKQEKGKPS